MVFMSFTTLDPTRWAALSDDKKVAEVALNKDGTISVTAHQTLKQAERDILELFIEEEQQKNHIEAA